MTWEIEGGSADLSSNVEDLVEALLDNGSNWTESTVGRTNIKFNNDWYDGQGSYTICVLPLKTTSTPAVIGASRFEYDDFINIHVFVRTSSKNRPSTLGVIQREVEKILGLNPTGLSGSNIRTIILEGWQVIQEQEHDTTLWHAIATAKVNYQKVKA